MASKSETARLLREFLQAYPDCKLTEEGLETYVRKLGEVPPELLGKAFDRLLETNRYFPTIAEIFGAVNDCKPPYPPGYEVGSPEWKAKYPWLAKEL